MHKTQVRPNLSGANGVRKMLSASICPMDLQFNEDKAPWSVAYFGGVQLQGINVFRDEGIGARNIVRATHHIQSQVTDKYIVAISVSNRSQVMQNGASSTYGPGSFVLVSTEKPFSASVSPIGSSQHFTQLLATVSGPMLRERLPLADEMTNAPMSAQTGAGRIMKSMFDLALAEGRALSQSCTTHFSRMLVDAVANAAIDAPPVEQAVPYRSPLARIREEAKDCIEWSLSNPMLDVALVAEHCRISTRYLHAAFADVSIRIGAYIREQRLLRCYADLQSPSQHNRSILDIAMCWGFDDAAHFSRLYKTRFGCPPSKDRG